MDGYLDFDLLVERAEDGYRATVLNSPAGQARADFKNPFSKQDTEILLLKVGRPRRGTRRIGSPEAQAVKAFGRRLFEAVFGSEIRACLRSSMDEAERDGVGLRIRLRLANAPELAELPWEYLYDSALNRFFSLSAETPLVRYLDLPEPVRPLHIDPPLRVLVMVASPSDYPPLDVENEWHTLKQAVRALEADGRLSIERLPTASLSCLQQRLRREDCHVFHFIGHGGFDVQADDGVLMMEDENKRGHAVSGNFLGTLLHDHRPLRLAVLNACEGARSSPTDPFAGTAQSLLQQGIPAVIGMQFEITDQAAITFAREFYMAVSDGYAIDAALAEARKAIYSQGNDVEWGTPVLYLRASDGHVFDVQQGQLASGSVDRARRAAERERLAAEAERERARQEAEHQREQEAVEKSRQAAERERLAAEAERERARQEAEHQREQEAAEQARQAAERERLLAEAEHEQARLEAERQRKQEVAEQARQAAERERLVAEAECERARLEAERQREQEAADRAQEVKERKRIAAEVRREQALELARRKPTKAAADDESLAGSPEPQGTKATPQAPTQTASSGTGRLKVFGAVAALATVALAWYLIPTEPPPPPLAIESPTSPQSQPEQPQLERQPERQPEPQPEKPPQSQHPIETPASPQPPETLPVLVRVMEANIASIQRVLAVAAEGVAPDIEAAARAAGRSFDFAGLQVQRDRATARQLNQQALAAFYTESDFSKAYGIQVQAFQADPLDVEIASNLGIFSFRLGKVEEAYRYAVYALSLPRAAERTGRTADWNTLAAVLASRGDRPNARNALFVTLAIAPDVKKRCQSAVDAVRNVYGPVLQRPTEAMFDRIRAQGLSDASECALPIAW